MKSIGRVTIIAEGRLVQTALNAAQGTDAGVINVRFIKPMDEKMLEKIADISQNVITLEDGIKYGGMGSAIKERLAGRVNVNVLGGGTHYACKYSGAGRAMRNFRKRCAAAYK